MPIVNLTKYKLIFPNGELDNPSEAIYPKLTSHSSNLSPHLRLMDKCSLEWVRSGAFTVESSTLYLVDADIYMSIILTKGVSGMYFAYPRYDDIDCDEAIVSSLVIHPNLSAEAWIKKWGDLLSNLFSV